MSDLIKLENVYFYWTKMNQPQVDKFDPEMKKYSINVAVTKAEAKRFKALKLNKTVKEMTGEEFEAFAKTPIPADLQNDDNEFFTISFNLKGLDAAGNLIEEWKRPKVYQMVDGKPVDRTSENVGNGSKGDLRFNTHEDRTGKVNTYLHSILVKELVPYESRGDEWASAAESGGGSSASSAADEELPF